MPESIVLKPGNIQIPDTAGFRELKNHWHLERLPFQKPKANEFRVMSRIMAMALFKIFQADMLPRSLHSLLRKTFLRRVLMKGPHPDESGKKSSGPLWLRV